MVCRLKKAAATKGPQSHVERQRVKSGTASSAQKTSGHTASTRHASAAKTPASAATASPTNGCRGFSAGSDIFMPQSSLRLARARFFPLQILRIAALQRVERLLRLGLLAGFLVSEDRL